MTMHIITVLNRHFNLFYILYYLKILTSHLGFDFKSLEKDMASNDGLL